MHERLRAARRNMHRLFPFSEALWLEWLRNELARPLSEAGDLARLEALFEAAVQDYLSIPIWTRYLRCACPGAMTRRRLRPCATPSWFVAVPTNDQCSISTSHITVASARGSCKGHRKAARSRTATGAFFSAQVPVRARPGRERAHGGRPAEVPCGGGARAHGRRHAPAERRAALGGLPVHALLGLAKTLLPDVL